MERLISGNETMLLMTKEEALIYNVKNRHNKLISDAINIMDKITDAEHSIVHTEDVVYNTARILFALKITDQEIIDICIIGAYWHDVGRLYCSKGHEEKSANMLYENMTQSEYNYSIDFIKNCCEAIKYHKYSMRPETIEGYIVKDADKLAYISPGRWINCYKENQKLDAIISLLPKLRDEILYFEETKKLYDKDIVSLTKFLYEKAISIKK